MRLYFEEYGNGLPVILIHGFPFDHTVFSKVAEILQVFSRVILPDLRGFGKSRAAGIVTLPNMAGDICELLDQLKIERTVLGGHSMGGYLSLEFSRRYPDRVAGLVLIASHPAADSEELRQNRMKNIERIQKGEARTYLLEGMLPKLTKDPGLAHKLEPIMLQTPVETLAGALGSMAERLPMTEWLKTSGIPVGMIYGEDDMIFSPAQAEEIAGQLVADPVVAVPAAGHMLMMENPTMAADGLRRFIQRVKSG